MACVSCSRPLPDGARFCPFCGHEVVGAATDERRVVTVVFADIVGYTALSEYLDPERVKRLADGAFERLGNDITAFGGRVDKILGDGILAIFGAPVAHEDDPDRAVRSAIQMHQSIDQFSRSQPDLDAPLRLRIGVNTGEVLVGSIVGTDDYTAMGDVVNVASRLQNLAGPGEIFVGNATASLASDEIIREPVDELEVRGRTQTERVWRIVGRQRRIPMVGTRTDHPFVGRALQRELLQSVMTMVANGRSVVVSVTGEAGSGKTRLVAELLERFPSRRVTIFAGVCAPYGENNVWAPIASALFRRLDLDASMPTDTLRQLARERAVSRYSFHADDPAVDRFVEAFMHLNNHPSALDAEAPAVARETLFRLIVEGLRLRSRRGPVVLWLDDLQWADPLLIDLLHRLTRSLVDRPVLLVTAQRDDASVDWPPSTDLPITIRLPLEPLSRIEAEDLLDSLLGDAGQSPLADQLYERSGGNPLFLTELAELARSNPESSELPGSLRALIAARLDRLDPGARAIIENASVLGSSGPIFSLEQFAQALDQPFDPDDLNALDDDGLFELDDGRWHFRSDVVREVAYGVLTKQVRAERHAGVASVLMAVESIPVDVVAHHAATAAELVVEIGPVEGVNPGINAIAVRLLLQATQRSMHLGGFSQAIQQSTRALTIGSDSAAVSRELMLLRSEAAISLRQNEAGRADADDALEAALLAQDERHEGMARRMLGMLDQISGNLDSSRRHLDASIDIFRSLRDDIELAASLRERGFAEVFGGSLDDADELLAEAEALSDQLDDRRGRAWVRQHQAWVAFFTGNSSLAEKRLLAASSEFADLGDRSGSNWATGLLAFVRYFQFRFEEAEALAVAVRAEATELGERWGPAMMDSLLASIRLWTGEFAEAEKLSRRSLTEFRALNDPFGIVQAHAPLNRALVALGRGREAERGIEEVLSLGELFGDLGFPFVAAAGTAVHLGLGERGAVVAEIAVDRMTSMGGDASEARTTYALALCQTGRADEALAVLENAHVDFPYACAVRAIACGMVGDDERALADSVAVAESTDATYLDRVYAGIAGAAVEVRHGAIADARHRLDRTEAIAGDAGDEVAITLASCAAITLLGGDVAEEVGHLRPGWHKVIAGLTGIDPHQVGSAASAASGPM